MDKIPFKIRPATIDDAAFIFDSWLRSYRVLDPWARSMHRAVYFSGHKKVIAQIIGVSQILVACSDEDPAQIYGYCVFQPTGRDLTIFHYLYVKAPFRRFGLGGSMYKLASEISGHNPSLPAIASHGGKFFEKRIKDKWKLIFNPYVLGEEFTSDQTKAA